MYSDNENNEYDANGDDAYFEKLQTGSGSEGDESDPLASSEENENERQAREEVFGAAIDDLIAERRNYGRRGRKRKPRTSHTHSAQKRARNTEVPRHLNSVMGAATLAYIRRDFEEASELLLRVIEGAPSAVAPRRTLALIYEEKGDKKKALELYMSAAELNRQDRELWKRNAALWEEEGDHEKAIYCLSNALRGANNKDVEALRGRGLLFKKLGKYSKAADNFGKIAKLVPDDLELAYIISDLHRKTKSPRKASVVIEEMLRDCEIAAQRRSSGRMSKLKAIQGLLEILIELRFVEKRYLDAAALLSRMKDVNAEIGCAMTFVQRLLEAICHHRLVSTTAAEPTFHEFMASPSIMTKHVVLLKQVADACREGSNFSDGVRAYSLLLNMGQDLENPVDIRLNRAVCCIGVGDMSTAKSDLEWVLSVHPRHVEASLRYQQFQTPKEVVRAKRKTTKKYSTLVGQYSLTAKERKEAGDALARGRELFEKGDFRGFLAQVFTPLENALFLCEPGQKTPTIPNDEGSNDNIDDLSVVRQSQRKQTVSFTNTDITGDVEQQASTEAEKERLQALGATLMRIMVDDQLVEIAEMIVFSFQSQNQIGKAYSLVRIFDSLAHLRISGGRLDLKLRLRILDVITSTAVGDIARAHDSVRILLLEEPRNADLAFAYTVIDQLWRMETDGQRHRSFQFLKRLRRKNPSLHLAFMAGNCSSRGGINIRRYTVGIYLHALKMFPNHPLICLVLAIQTLYVAAGRRIQNRNEMVTYALGFLSDYVRNRRKDVVPEERCLYEMETDYNLGRAMHQLGLLHFATEAYMRVLDSKYDGIDKNGIPEWADLRRDAAFNLIQIYRAGGNIEMASAICNEYLVF